MSYYINGELDVQSKLGEIIARLDTAVLTVLINNLYFQNEDGDMISLYCLAHGAQCLRCREDLCKQWRDCFTHVYDTLKDDNTDIPTVDTIYEIIREITDMEISYRYDQDLVFLPEKEDVT